jgi:hypothetical protein
MWSKLQRWWRHSEKHYTQTHTLQIVDRFVFASAERDAVHIDTFPVIGKWLVLRHCTACNWWKVEARERSLR